MSDYRNPTWWNKTHDSAWERVKDAFRRDWEQTKHDFGAKTPDLNQDVGDTLAQAAGSRPIPPRSQPNFEAQEPGYKFGYGARMLYGRTYPKWDDKLEAQLRDDWRSTRADAQDDWDKYRDSVKYGWHYGSRQ